MKEREKAPVTVLAAYSGRGPREKRYNRKARAHPWIAGVVCLESSVRLV